LKPFAIVLVSLTLALFPASSGAQIGDIQKKQVGPGVASLLFPLRTNTSLQLATENTTIVLHERHALVEALYFFYNPTKKTIREKVAFLTLHLGGSKIQIREAQETKTHKKLPRRYEKLSAKPKHSYSAHVPVLTKFDLTMARHVFTLSVPPKTKKGFLFRYKVPYLYYQIQYKGRVEQSPRMFRFIRSQPLPWRVLFTKSRIEVVSKLSQINRRTFAPNLSLTKKKEHVLLTQETHPKHTRQDIVVTYDPIRFDITSRGFKTGSDLRSKPRDDKRSYAPANLVDGDYSTYWCEGEKGNARGKGFEVRWSKLLHIKEVKILPGVVARSPEYEERNRLRKINLYMGNSGWLSEKEVISFKDHSDIQSYIPQQQEKSSFALIQIMEVYPGLEVNETCFSEIVLEFEDPLKRPEN